MLLEESRKMLRIFESEQISHLGYCQTTDHETFSPINKKSLDDLCGTFTRN